MDSDTNRHVSGEQLHALIQFMKEHPELAEGLNRGRRASILNIKLWNICTKKLNGMKNGAKKDPKGWSKYWSDWKYRVRRHALELRVARDTNKIPTEGITALSPIEKTILSIIGDRYIDEVVVKSDPLINQDSNETRDDEAGSSEHNETKTKAVKRRRQRKTSTVETADLADSDDDDDDSGSPPQQRARFEEAEESECEYEDTTTKFLRLEKKQLENAKRIQQSVCQITLQICKLTDIMGDIRDVLVKRFNSVDFT